MVEGGVRGLLIAIWISRWAQYARIARAKSLALREAEFVQTAHVLGYSQLRILVRHIMPNVFSEALAYALSDFIFIIVIVGGLSFLGLGVRPPTPEWGAMLAEGRPLSAHRTVADPVPRLLPLADGHRRCPAGARPGADQQRRRRVIILKGV